MHSPRDKELALLSRKHRLMAAAVAGEDPALPVNTPRADRNGLGGLVHCFICGSGVTAGKELRLQVTYQKERFPFFPFLQNQEPAPGASELSPEGHALVCAVCHCFLAEQWNSFERSRTPVEKRMYWLKRPYQCDSRRVPQEWNISYELERRISTGSHNYDGGAESDFSSFSDNLSDQEMDVVDRGALSKDKCPRAAGKSQRDGSRKNCVKNSPDSPRTLPRCSAGVYGAQGSPKPESVPPPRRAPKVMNNMCQSSYSLAKFQERIPQRCHDNHCPDTPVQENGVIMRNRSFLEPRHIQRGPDGGCASPGYPQPANAVNSKCNRDTQGSISNEDEINITSDEDRDPLGRANVKCRVPAGDLLTQKVAQLRRSAKPNADGCACFICGTALAPSGSYKVSVQKQETAQGEPFFPFLWLHTPPPGALAIGPAGATLVCCSCHASLMQQWHNFQQADVPVLQRLYVVPLNPGAASQQDKPARPFECDSEGAREACFLCGQECGADKVVHVQAGVGKSRGAMYFPFIDMLPCPPNAQPMRNGRVRCCSQCLLILEDIWSAYRLCLSEDLITSVSSFLVRYHSVMASEGFGAVACQTGVSSESTVSVCYLCGSELSTGCEFQLPVNPPGRCGEKEPFFPFLTVHPPAPRAKPVDATGLVSSCALCYHDLHNQWAQHEGKGLGPCAPSTPSTSGSSSSPWARQYTCEAFMCFFCRQEQRRHGRLCMVTVARLPVFLYAARGARTLLVDDGRRLTVGSCVDCKSMVQVGQSARQDRERLGHGASDGREKNRD
ncbi:uncharacterized protein LOC133497924 [Syngnathoides biaculeatus]|uniref:uncharacterized protein LOC133497924 n=1 Tax=Syngnathoides biaculeatus TaxID=300417 RepID=UPI002ADDD5DB|nr:uncharacterized protein LOC133497924 [Syngnathoides biaculeatus]XP_061670183.1 uncharacterized protein LOC133497924 [Syngnathoides biaculeatus]XP_061670184.1 uncharacterized protein LOC133497924 [Syngnathoides biaculeatus]